MPSTRRTTEFEADIEAKKCQLIADFFVGHTVLVPQRSGKPSLIGKVVNLTACKRFACVHVHGVSIDGEEHPMPESDIEIETSSLEKFYFDYTREHEPILAGKSHPEGYYDYVVHLYKLGSKVEEEVKDAEKQFNKCKRRFEQTQEKYDKVFANAEGPVYERSITNKLETATCRLNEAQEKLTEINTRRCLLKFASAQSCVDYVKNKYNINLMRRTLARRVKGFGKKAVGGIVALPPEVEENLMRTALEFDKMGFAVTEHFVIELANATRRDTRASPLGQGWYKAWFNRCKRRNPDLVQVFTSKLKTAVFDSYNSTSINWWYDVVKHSLVHDLQVAKEVHVESKPQREMDWLFPNRVLIFDETSLYGQKDIESRTGYKVITEKGRIDCGGRVRRTDVKAPSGHVTFIAGHNLTMNTMPLVAILSRRITEEVRAEINIALKGKVGSDRFGPANGQLYSDLILGESAEGSVTKDNIKEVILDGVIKTMYPDASNDDPSKRVVIFIDWHGSRLSSDFLSECRSRGVYIHCWLPNCTPTMQSPDIVLFGKFKSVFKSLTRKQYKKLSMVDLVSLGVDAFAKVANSSNYHEGVKLSGMLPFTRQVHFNLNKEIIRIGDERARLKLEKIRTSHLDAMHKNSRESLSRSMQPITFIPSPTNREIGVSTASTSVISDDTDSIIALERARDAAASVISERISKHGVIIGPNNSFARTARTREDILSKAASVRLLAGIEKANYAGRMPSWIERIHQRSTEEIETAKRKMAEEIETAKRKMAEEIEAAKRKQQNALANLKTDEMNFDLIIETATETEEALSENLQLSELEIIPHREALTRVAEMLDVIKNASRDDAGAARVANYCTRLDLVDVPDSNYTNSPMKRKLDELAPTEPVRRRNRQMAASSINQRIGPRIVDDSLIDELREREQAQETKFAQKQARAQARAEKQRELEGKVIRFLRKECSIGVTEKRTWLRQRIRSCTGSRKEELSTVLSLPVHQGGDFHNEFEKVAMTELKHFLNPQGSDGQ